MRLVIPVSWVNYGCCDSHRKVKCHHNHLQKSLTTFFFEIAQFRKWLNFGRRWESEFWWDVDDIDRGCTPLVTLHVGKHIVTNRHFGDDSFHNDVVCTFCRYKSQFWPLGSKSCLMHSGLGFLSTRRCLTVQIARWKISGKSLLQSTGANSAPVYPSDSPISGSDRFGSDRIAKLLSG